MMSEKSEWEARPKDGKKNEENDSNKKSLKINKSKSSIKTKEMKTERLFVFKKQRMMSELKTNCILTNDEQV